MDGRSRQNPAYRPTKERAPISGRVLVLGAALALTSSGSVSAETPDPTQALRRHAPVLRYDPRDPNRATSVESLTRRRLDARGKSGDTVALHQPPHPPDVVYGRVVRAHSGRTWLQYWLLYAANPQDRGIVRTGRHEGDWEVVQVELDDHGRPRRAVFAEHSWAQACDWNAIEHRGAAPVVYIANGSHASYPHAGEHGRPWPDPDDETSADGPTIRPRVIPITSAAPPWIRWPGRWGRSDGGLIPGEQASPRGPAFQPDGPWRDPDAYARRARSCGSGAPSRPVAISIAAAAAAVVAAAALCAAARGRRSAAR